MKLITTFILSIFISGQLSAQLKGDYLIGKDTSADFETVTEGLGVLRTQGASGDVFFNLLPDTYAGFRVDSIASMNNHRLYIQSQKRDSSTVVFSGSGMDVVNLMEAVNVTLRDITIISYSRRCVFAKWISNCELDRCLFLTPKQKGKVGDDVSIMIKNLFDGPTIKALTIKNCIFRGGAGGFNMTGYKGVLTIDSCRFENTGRYGIYANWIEKMSIKNSVLRGEMSVDWQSGGVFQNNVVYGYGDFEYKYITGNEFLSSHSSDFRASLIRNNTFVGGAGIDYNGVVDFSGTIDSNEFIAGVSVNRMFSLTFRYNKVGNASFYSIGTSDIYGNIFNLNCNLSRVGTTFKNNLVYGKASFSFGAGTIAHNNFGGYTSISDEEYRINGNNFSGETQIHIYANCSHNNYYPNAGVTDRNPYHINPEYVSSTEMRAQNPLLIGAGLPMSSLKVDIDGELRDSLPTIGAHAFCVPQYSEHGAFELFCGAEMTLKRCPSHKTAGAFWVSEWGDIYKSSESPVVKPSKSGYYIFLDHKGQRFDSAHIEVKNFTSKSQPDTLIRCEEQVQFNSIYHPNAKYSWQPTTGLSASNIRNPIARPKKSTEYINTINIPGCGTYYDTARVQVNAKPQAYGFASAHNLEATFTDFSHCTDSIYWHFGDGQGSSDEIANHTYKESKQYEVRLEAFLDTAKDEFAFNLLISTGVGDVPSEAEIQLFPNPSKGHFWIENQSNSHIEEIRLYTSQGKMLKLLPYSKGQAIDLNGYQGFYLIEIRLQGQLPIFQKIAIE